MVQLSDTEEKTLLRRLKQGDQQAFRQLYDRYSRIIYSNIRKLTRDEAVSDDLLQDVFVKIWEHREHIDPAQSFKAYLFTCSRHFVFNFKRRLKLEIEAAIRLAAAYEDTVDSVAELLYAKETEAALHDAINHLPEQRQHIFRLCKLEGKSYQEVADLLGITVSTVRDHMVKANKFIKARLAQGGSLLVVLLVGWLSSGL